MRVHAAEILVQVGLIVAGVGAVSSGWLGYLAVVVAPLYIILLMIAECGRADRYMDLRYGDRADFREYVGRSGSILPRLG